MLGLYVSVPIAGFRKGLARDYWESEPLPPPATCYGFLLALIGEEDRCRHQGVRIAPALLSEPDRSVVLRTAWRVKVVAAGLGANANRTPVEQELLSGVRLAVWIDSSREKTAPVLEARLRSALQDPASVERFGGLALGESTHLVDEVHELVPDPAKEQMIFSLAERGRLSLPVWVDHVGSAGTRWVSGELRKATLTPPVPESMPLISPD